MYISTLISLLALAPQAIQVSARPATRRSCASKGGAGAGTVTNGKAIYMLTNKAPNAVIAVPIAQDGTLDEAGGSRTETGGSGATGKDGSTGEPSKPDALFSQSALTVAGNVSQSCLCPSQKHWLILVIISLCHLTRRLTRNKRTSSQ